MVISKTCIVEGEGRYYIPFLHFNFPFFLAFWWSQDNLPMLHLPVMCGSYFIGPPVPSHNLPALQQLHDTILLNIICIMTSLQCTWSVRGYTHYTFSRPH